MITEKLTNIRIIMQSEKIDLVAIGPTAYFKWLVGQPIHGDERPCFILVSKSKAAILLPAVNIGDPNIFKGLKFFKWTDEKGYKAAFNQMLDYLQLGTVQHVSIDEGMRTDFSYLILNKFPNAQKSLTSKNIAQLRMCKTEKEYQELKLNSNYADQAINSISQNFKQGMTEVDVAEIIIKCFTKNGAKPAFTIVATAKNGASPHHMTGDNVIENNAGLLVDIGCKYGQFSSDITRMFYIGKPSKKYLEIHKIVERAVQAALKASRVGAIASDIDKAARDVITKAGYGEFFIHRTGHGLGVEPHELPYISAGSDTILEAGMVFSIEPGIYLPNEFGVRLEEIIYLREDGPEILSNLSRDLVRMDT
ncbi:MAG: aminopeptidase P family protein [Rhizobiales bacterium]|nr:aminopeptidase P family protein [Hyphomicrobiales bacterium]